MKENPDRKKVDSALQHLKISKDFSSMMGEEHLNVFSFVCIHRDIFLDYDEIIEIYVSKCPRRILLINPLSEN